MNDLDPVDPATIPNFGNPWADDVERAVWERQYERLRDVLGSVCGKRMDIVRLVNDGPYKLLAEVARQRLEKMRENQRKKDIELVIVDLSLP